jgi:hypothetical protein
MMIVRMHGSHESRMRAHLTDVRVPIRRMPVVVITADQQSSPIDDRQQ